MPNLGKKIAIVGVSASGKSTFARKLAERTCLPVFFMDSIMWKPGWNYVGDEETVLRLQEISSGTEWIIEGYITKGARSVIFDRADTVIYLDYPRWVASGRYILRWLKHRKDPRPELAGSPEKFSFKFLKLVWNKGETRSLDALLAQMSERSKIIRLTSPKKSRIFLHKI
ncbi:MAG: topology modulation protein [Candidatus Taylorbacteria bacterium]|nr:topology modulation protein [Candidatus Taylorbacteria bacterium]